MGSRSRSRSRSSERLHLDRFGRIIPRDKRSRSRSLGSSRRSRRRSRSRSHSRHRFSRRRSRSRSRSNRPRAYRSRSKSKSPVGDLTNLPDLKLMLSRVFIGHLPYDKVTKEELEQMFAKYGKVLGISIHERGFGFIQFEKESEAREAVKQEAGSLLKGNNIDVKMALEGRRNAGVKPARGNARPSPPPGGYDADRYPARRSLPGAPAERERSPLRGDPYEDRYRDPYRDPVGLPPRLTPPAAGVGGDSLSLRGGGRSEDNERRDDPYRRPLPADDPYYDRYREDMYRFRRDPYATDPYRDPYYRDYPGYEVPPPPPRKPQPADCEIILLNSQLWNYGEFVERKLKAHNLVVAITVIAEDRTIPQVIEDSSKRGHLFAVVVNSQNEAHQSLTINILHGTPQEHRNMPVDDAMTLIARSFDQYTQSLREKAAPATERAPPPPSSTAAPLSRAPPPFLPPGPDISYLLNLLADNRQLTLEEIDKVITYLGERKEKMYEAEGHRPTLESGGGYGASGDVRKDESASLQQQQQELQAKILSILNGPGEPGGQHPKPGRPGMSMGNGAGHGSSQGVSSLINFDNPSVQKALDNLIQSGPNLLKNISSAPGNPTSNQGIMSRDGEAMRHEQRMQHVGYGGSSMAGNAPMQQPGGSGGGGGQGPMGGMQPSQRPMYGSVAGASQARGGPMQQPMRRPF